ncbi:hypothetical protein pipiens_019763, partial [Culex pipiens pipiens]
MKNKLKFLLNCRKCKVVPTCLNYRMRIWLSSEVSRQELKQLERKQKLRLISVVISDTMRQLEHLRSTKRCLCEKLKNNTKAADWKEIEEVVEAKAAKQYHLAKEREVKKLDNLKKKRITSVRSEPTWVENTTNTELPDFMERTLLLGPNYNVQNNRSIPYVRFVADVENAIRKKTDFVGEDVEEAAKKRTEAEDMRAEVSNMISNYVNYQHQQHPKENNWIQQDIMRSKHFLRENDQLYVTRADKGNKVVVIGAEEYR